MDFLESLKQWERNSRADALYSVLSDPRKRGGKWDVDEFFQTGRDDIGRLLEHLRTRALLPASRARALDFGCGVGRLTQALASHFDRVVGVDAAPTMIARAISYNTQGERVSYLLNQQEDLHELPDASFDLILSLIVLQHIPTQSALRYIAEFTRLLAPGGCLVFQVPSRLKVERSSSFRSALKNSLPESALQFYRRWTKRPLIPMFPIERARVEALLASSPVELVHVQPDLWAGNDWESFTYFVVSRLHAYSA